MPRKKFAVHKHFRRAPEQGNRKIELVECIHCGHRIAGNNAARLWKHLQNGCWPASGPDDPSLQLDRPTSGSQPAAITDPNLNTISRLDPALQVNSAAQRPAARGNAASSNIQSAESVFTTLPFLLINATVKETKDPVVSRLLAVPRNLTFRNLQRALSTAFGYKNVNGLFDISYPAWVPGKGRPPRRGQVCIFHDEEQRNKWHAWDDMDSSDSPPDERFMDEVTLDALLMQLKSCTMVFHVGPWAHDVEVLGGTSLQSSVAVSQGRAWPICLSGQGHGVLETSDPLMWQAFKDAYNAAAPTPTQKAYCVYYEKECKTGDPRGLSGAMPWKWEIDNVNRELRLLPVVRHVSHVVAPEEYQQSSNESVDGEDDDSASNDSSNHVLNAQAGRHAAGQNDQGIYDQNHRGLSHQIPNSPYSLTDPSSGLEQLRYN